MLAFMASFTFIVLAEMGDKTQLLVMAFTAKYKAYQVLTAIFLATLVLQSLAVAAGKLLTSVVPLDVISLIAAASFIAFGLWTIRGESAEEGDDKKESRFGPVVTVALAFLLAEMGDKTQLATISLSVKYQSILGVLLGSTLGLVTADAIGIVVGVVMRRHIPERTMQWVSAAVFILFGLAGIYESLDHRVGRLETAGILAVITAATVAIVCLLARRNMPPPGNVQCREQGPGR